MRPHLPARPHGLNRRKAVVLVAVAALAPPAVGAAATATELSRDSRLALDNLYAKKPKTREWGKSARAILVFPKIVKAGVLIGGMGGDGALLVKNQPTAFYRIAAGSIGLELGAQAFSYAMFFMTAEALDYVKRNEGWSVGAGPTVAFVDEGAADSLTTTTMQKDIYAVAYGQRGLMAGVSLEGSKITRIRPKAA